VEASESADFNFVAGSHGTDDAVKYGADGNVGFLLGQLSGLTNLFSQISPGHLEHPDCITEKSNTTYVAVPDDTSWLHPRSSLSGQRPRPRWDKMKDWLLHGAIEADEMMAADLAGPGYHINRSNLLVLESKADMQKREPGRWRRPGADLCAARGAGGSRRRGRRGGIRPVHRQQPLWVDAMTIILEAMEYFFVCPYCGERISMVLDTSVKGQTYVEDCEVCCQPVEVRYTVKDDEVCHFEASAM
jgi:Cysteine-rich CPXCG